MESTDLRTIKDEELKEVVISEREDFLKEIGFQPEDIENIYSEYETLLKEDVVIEAIENLTKKGFNDPIKMISTFPPILGYSFENIDNKIKGLEERGFQDPIKMISTLPPILGYSFENIDKKLHLFNSIISKYSLNFSATSLIEYFPSALGNKMDKLYVVTRIMTDIYDNNNDVDEKTIFKILINNIENILIAHSELNKPINEKIFYEKLKEVKKRKYTKEEKREILSLIEEGHRSHKAVDRYFRGYTN